MVTFARNEIISSSQFVRSFASLLQRMTKSNDEKIAIVKNNQMQAVMIPIDEYERLATLAEKAEQKSIFDTIQERKDTPTSEYISYDDAMKMAGV